ncbi:MAG: AAA family ATPase [Fibrobacter sp.]|nr:AAA family ATPase [Fibrobacter sp.]
MNFIESKNFEEFYDGLKEMRGISAIDKHLLNLLFEIQPGMNLEVQKFLALCFSLLDDGNTRLPMDTALFEQMWFRKWQGLVQLNISASETEVDEADFPAAENFSDIIAKGVTELSSLKYSEIIEGRSGNEPIENDDYSKPFILAAGKIPYLYFAKHFNAKCYIEKSASLLFKNGNVPATDAILNCIKEISNIRKPINGKPFLVNEQQATAILRGLNENLIITGGPGTGKTTVVLYILWKLLQSNPEMLDWSIYLAAPSGKAADRMRESLSDGLAAINDGIRESEICAPIFNKLKNLESSTIHRLLKFSREKGDFHYNKDEQFSKNSIFVIDEASMIDIEMFAALLQAIPEGARLFILGDPYQLPSVDSGAVLGEILKAKNSDRNFTVKLEISNRFTDDSLIGRLAHEIKVVAESKEPTHFKPHNFLLHPALSSDGDTMSYANYGSEKSKDLVSYYRLESESEIKTPKKLEEKRIEKIVNDWIGNFTQLSQLAEQIHPSQPTGETALRDELWNLSLTQRMLSAERRGARGVDNLNKKVCSKLRALWKKSVQSADSQPRNNRSQSDITQTIQDSGYFPGQLLIITQNQEMYKLYNGDTGIVVFEGFTPYLMLKKAPPQDSNVTRDNYVFYPLSVLPEDAIESAFAITIHKSQGSEYKHVTMFLPKQKGHPLLTNQILYTGITRAKESVTIVASPETFRAACCTVTERETGIEL